MSGGPVLVELCAGSAAVSLRWLSSRAKPPIAYQGGKRAYADAILVAMGLQPGGGSRDGRVVLVEAGPWGEAWQFWAAGGIPDTVERLRAWAGEDPRVLWERLADAPVPVDVGERVATWAVLQFWAFGRKPVRAMPRGWTARAAGISTTDIDPQNTDSNRSAPCLLPSLVDALAATWRTAGFNASAAYHAERFLERGHTSHGCVTSELLPAVADALESVPSLPVDVRCTDARTVAPIPGAHVYIDPDYQGTTGYGHTFPRADVLATAERWRAAGCTVAISEAEPLPLDGWHHHALGKPHGNRRTWSKQQSEWLTISRPAGGQIGLAL